ncbi:MAG: CaiB/BaiF CoA transferase family protein [Limnohabitans sp.]|jgi:crotonobetainyl-CoA:carnitine CoA-transferase CaiB-like acyl-CoA transferase
MTSDLSASNQARRSRPLDHITVVSLEHAIAAPFCTRQLADLGARVIKIERPEVGDFARAYDQRARGQASHFVWVNRSKESLALDLKNAQHLEVLKALIAKADVVVQNLAPGASTRMGLDAKTLRSQYPRLIVCDISGYGLDGPYKDKKAYDLLIQSEAGYLSVTGTPDSPSKSGNSIADIAAGMYAYTNILSAIIQRDKTGEGSHIDVSMLESLSEWMGFPMYYAMDGASPPPRSAASHATIYPYGPFEVGGALDSKILESPEDQGTVMLGLQNEREWVLFCQHVLMQVNLSHDLRFESNAKRNEHRQALEEIILNVFSHLTVSKVIERLEIAQIANARMNSMSDLWAHPQLKARDRWVTVPSPSGDLPALLPPGRQTSFDYRMDPIPTVGEHTEKILKELGMPPIRP